MAQNQELNNEIDAFLYEHHMRLDFAEFMKAHQAQ